MTDELANRIAAFKKGQLSWPVLGCNKWCANCKHYDGEEGADISPLAVSRGQGRCRLIMVHTKKNGVLFVGADAIGCAKYEDA